MATKDKDGLTNKQRKYCQLRAGGKTQVKAYKDSGYSSKQSKRSMEVNACKLDNTEKIQKKIREYQEKADNDCILTAEQRKAVLTEFYCDSTKSDKDRLKAIDMLNKMDGAYIDRKEIAGSVGITRDDRKKAMEDALESLKQAWNE